MRTPRHKLLQHTYRSPYTDDQIEYAHTAAANGASINTIARTIKATPDMLTKAFYRRGISIRHVRATYTLVIRQLAAQLDIPHRTIDRFVLYDWLHITRDGRYRYITLEQLQQFLACQYAWSYWKPQTITIDWLRDLADEARNVDVRGYWLGLAAAARWFGISQAVMAQRVYRKTVTLHPIGSHLTPDKTPRYLIWCPKEY